MRSLGSLTLVECAELSRTFGLWPPWSKSLLSEQALQLLELLPFHQAGTGKQAVIELAKVD